MTRIILSVCATAALCMFGLYAISFAGNLVPPARYAAMIAEAVDSGALARRVSLPFGAESFSVSNFNDCLIFSMLVLQRDERAALGAISPRVPTVETLWDGAAPAGYPPYAQCRDLAVAMAGPAPASPYHRYLHGGWILAKAMLAALPLAIATNVLGLLAVGTLIVLIAGAVRHALRSPTNRRRDVAYAALGTTLLVFHALPIFGRSFSFAPADIVLHAALLYFYRHPPSSLSSRRLTIGAALFGSLTAIFEFLTGDIPSSAMALLAIMALDQWPDARTMLRRTILALSSFAGAIALCFALKLAAVAAVWGPQEIVAMAGALDNHLAPGGWEIAPENAAQLRAWGLPFDAAAIKESRVLSALYGLGKMAYFARLLTFGSAALAAVLILAAPLVLAARHGVIALQTDGTTRWRALLLLAGCAVVPAWCFVMASHTIVHAHFMFRLLAWPLALLAAAEAWRLFSPRTA